MSDFGTLVTRCLLESHKPNETTSIKRAIVSALRHYQPFRTHFSQKTGTIATVAGTQEYSLPADFVAMDDLRLLRGTIYTSVERINAQEMRDYVISSGARGIPDVYAVHHSKLLVYPIPNGIYTLSLWYQFDSTRDTATGNEITVASGNTVTNDWFNRGEEALRTRALADFFLTRIHDSEKSTLYQHLNTQAEKSLLRQTNLTTGTPATVRGYL